MRRRHHDAEDVGKIGHVTCEAVLWDGKPPVTCGCVGVYLSNLQWYCPDSLDGLWLPEQLTTAPTQSVESDVNSLKQ